MSKTIYWFRRDLRLHDNAAIASLANPTAFVFIFTPEQTLKNQLRNDRALYFIFESLADLGRELHSHGHKLHILYGHPGAVLGALCSTHGFTSIVCGRDYSPYSIARDASIEAPRLGPRLLSIENMTLLPIGTVKTAAGNAYVKYTPFYNAAAPRRVPKPCGLSLGKIPAVTIPCESLQAMQARLLPGFVPHKATVRGGRSEGLARLHSVDLAGTTKLSAYINRGCLSSREVYAWFKKKRSTSKIRELWWREFYINLVWANPKVLSKNRMPARWAHTWSTKYDKRALAAWCQGKTGYPLIDASMQELNETGFMHNRGRMMCAEFLCKRLFINWELGERYFAAKLVDYDAIQNACNWMWVAFVQPYFRMTNPEHGHPDYLEYLGDRLAKTKPCKRIPILTNEQVIARYEKK
jgi:deoxyribodipyrimidine photo-lyase